MSIRGKIVDLSQPKVMGVLNLTPDSFHAGSRHTTVSQALKSAEGMLRDGASFLDVGGYSSRPGADEISVKEELSRTVSTVDAIKKEFPQALISIDTFRSEVAKANCDVGAGMINDISGGTLDPAIADVAAQHHIPFIVMHMRGTPMTMTRETTYENLLSEVLTFLGRQAQSLQEKGVNDIIVDPGFGFAKTVSQNYVMLKNLGYFTSLELPLLVGLSRKSMIYKKLGIQPEEALNGTTVLNTLALAQGARILRVHDVREAVEATTLFDFFEGAQD